MERVVTRKQLEWVSRNRRERRRGEALSAAAARVVERIGGRIDGGWMRRAEAAVAGVTDEMFRRHCEVRTMDGGVLTIEVEDPRLVGSMRLRWSEPIGKALTQSRLSGRVRAVRFVAGMGPPWRRAVRVGRDDSRKQDG